MARDRQDGRFSLPTGRNVHLREYFLPNGLRKCSGLARPPLLVLEMFRVSRLYTGEVYYEFPLPVYFINMDFDLLCKILCASYALNHGGW